MNPLTSLLPTGPVAKIRTLKTLIWLGASLPLLRLLILGMTDDLGANPVEFVERSTGTWGLVFLLLSLGITPLRQWTQQAWLIAVRRLLGLWMFAYACLHVLTYLWLDYSFDWPDIVKDIIKHPYVLVGASAFLLTLPLAATSNQRAIRALKQRWKSLHKLVYVIGLLVLLHYWWLVKKDVTEPVIYSMVFAGLMIARWKLHVNQAKR
ncbi:sulfite oxidase heme-binding subunit YedZ [Methylophilus sp. Leaf414]|uniref:sulfite oxidase heme-binding subunit YedZ n=1 Tax=Methylophilus sp. Leaf414 TaxID=1736371 RepID=UPI0006F7BF50|nr:protein-methionine-sulfoxide reductase heme-binding subunit MsrQ [Methylophilus sp. Leaf414]KQT37451.1 sulfite oxidase [Methylophilus sp. Leaf414]